MASANVTIMVNSSDDECGRGTGGGLMSWQEEEDEEKRKNSDEVNKQLLNDTMTNASVDE